MMDLHLRVIEKRLTENTEVKLVDHWNNQVQYAEQERQLYPAAYIDFGTVTWTRLTSSVKQAQAVITVHCVSKNTRETHHKAEDKDGKRLVRFDWAGKVMEALDGFSANDKDGNLIIKSMQLAGSAMDTNHEALSDDVVIFSCFIYYMDRWKGKDTEALIASVATDRVD